MAVGLVRVGNRGYWLPRHLVSLLTDPDDPGYLSGHLSYLALRSLDFDAFDEFFRDGLVSARRQRHLVEAFGEATRFDHTAFLEVALGRVPSLKARLAAGCDILDVGAGAGTWELRVAPRFPKSSFVGLEPDRTALRLAQADAARRKLSPRVQFVAGDAEAMRFVERFDVVYLGEMLCAALDPGRVLVRCRRALRLHGVIVICEGLVDETAAATDGQNAIVLPMQLEFALQPARFLGRRELHGLLTASGFGRARFVPVGGGLWFAIASRS